MAPNRGPDKLSYLGVMTTVRHIDRGNIEKVHTLLITYKCAALNRVRVIFSYSLLSLALLFLSKNEPRVLKKLSL